MTQTETYPLLADARRRFMMAMAALSYAGRVVILCDGDVDGLGAAVVLTRYLERHGFAPADILPMHPPKGSNAFTPAVTDAVGAHDPVALFVLDLGINGFDIAPGVPTLLIDHHRPTGAPPDSTAITGYAWQPVPTTSLLTYLLCSGGADMNDVAWVAAIGNIGDLGPDDPDLTQAVKVQRQKYIRAATSLLNAAKRSSDPDTVVPAAFRLLCSADTARAIVESDSPDARILHIAKAEVDAALAEARRVAPRFSTTEKVALLRFDSPARIHPLLAQSWRGRLPQYIVMAANGGYLPERVSFSVRTNVDTNLLNFLARHGTQLEGVENEYGHGHDKATGGTLSRANFARLLDSMGFAT